MTSPATTFRRIHYHLEDLKTFTFNKEPVIILGIAPVDFSQNTKKWKGKKTKLMNEVEKYIGKNYYRRSYVHSFLLDGRWEIDTTYSGVQKLGVGN